MTLFYSILLVRTGTIPPALGKLSSLSSLDVSNNNFIGMCCLLILTWCYFVEMFVHVVDLFRAVCSYYYTVANSGPIPSELGNLTKLTRLNAEESSLTGQ